MDFIPLYKRWLNEVKQETSPEMFRLWLYSLTDQQLEEVNRKWGKFDEFWVGITKISSEIQRVKTQRVEYSLLAGFIFSAPLDDPKYYSVLINAALSGKSYWNRVDNCFLEKASEFYNCLTINSHTCYPYFSEEIAKFCRDIIAERELLEIRS